MSDVRQQCLEERERRNAESLFNLRIYSSGRIVRVQSQSVSKNRCSKARVKSEVK